MIERIMHSALITKATGFLEEGKIDAGYQPCLIDGP